jgi:hypothetical protein
LQANHRPRTRRVKKKFDLTHETGWDELRRHVAGEIGRQDYDALTMRETVLIMQGYGDRQVHDYRNTRMVMFMMARLHADPKKAPKSPEDLWELPGDEPGQLNEDYLRGLFDELRRKQEAEKNG